MKDKIDRLIIKQLTNIISEQEEQELNQWIALSDDNRHYYEHIMNDTDLSDRFKAYKNIDEDKAWNLFQKRCLHRRYSLLSNIAKYAAILMLPVVGIALWLSLSDHADIKPTLSHTAQAYMSKSMEMGKEKATLILPNGRSVSMQGKSNIQVQNISSTYMQSLSPTNKLATKNNTLATNKGNEYWLTFEDGTIVHLNYKTTLMYPTHFNSDDRTVYLDGEAYFQVAKDKRPFRVITANSVVKEYGTAFNVNTKAPGKTEVVLVEGSISVTPLAGKEQMMKPGDLATILSTSKVTIAQTDIESYIAWNKGRFVFDQYTLDQVMKVISLWYDMDVKFMSEDIKQMHYTGSIDKYGPIHPLLNAIKMVTHLDINIQNKQIVISK